MSDKNEKNDYLVGLKGLHLYGKSLLYLVSRALDDERKIPLLGFERALERRWANDTDQWAASHLPFVEKWQARFKGGQYCVTSPSVPINKEGKTERARHGSFDNNLEVVTATIERIAGRKVVKPLEWLDY